MPKYVARISPASKREQHVHRGRFFRKSKGWHGPFSDEKLANELRVVRENEMNPHTSIPVFEVKEVEEAKAVAAAEKRVSRPAGTPETPNPVPGGDPDAKAELKKKAEAALAAKKVEPTPRRQHKAKD